MGYIIARQYLGNDYFFKHFFRLESDRKDTKMAVLLAEHFRVELFISVGSYDYCMP